MKKNYLKPSIIEIELKSCQQLLAGSGEVSGVGGNGGMNYGGAGGDTPACSRGGRYYYEDDDFEDEEE